MAVTVLLYVVLALSSCIPWTAALLASKAPGRTTLDTKVKRAAYLGNNEVPPISSSDSDRVRKEVSAAVDSVMNELIGEYGNASSDADVHTLNSEKLVRATEDALNSFGTMHDPSNDQELIALAREVSDAKRSLKLAGAELDRKMEYRANEFSRVYTIRRNLEAEIQVMINLIQDNAKELLENTGRRRRSGERRADTDISGSADSNPADDYLVISIPDETAPLEKVDLQAAESRLRTCSLDALRGKTITRGIIRTEEARVYFVKLDFPPGVDVFIVGLPEGDD